MATRLHCLKLCVTLALILTGIVALATFSKDEINHDFFLISTLKDKTKDYTNTYIYVILTNVFNIVTLMFYARWLFHMFRVNPIDPYLEMLMAFMTFTQLLAVLFGFLSFGQNCAYASPKCIYIPTLLYLFVLIYDLIILLSCGGFVFYWVSKAVFHLFRCLCCPKTEDDASKLLPLKKCSGCNTKGHHLDKLPCGHYYHKECNVGKLDIENNRAPKGGIII